MQFKGTDVFGSLDKSKKLSSKDRRRSTKRNLLEDNKFKMGNFCTKNKRNEEITNNKEFQMK